MHVCCGQCLVRSACGGCVEHIAVAQDEAARQRARRIEQHALHASWAAATDLLRAHGLEVRAQARRRGQQRVCVGARPHMHAARTCRCRSSAPHCSWLGTTPGAASLCSGGCLLSGCPARQRLLAVAARRALSRATAAAAAAPCRWRRCCGRAGTLATAIGRPHEAAAAVRRLLGRRSMLVSACCGSLQLGSRTKRAACGKTRSTVTVVIRFAAKWPAAGRAQPAVAPPCPQLPRAEAGESRGWLQLPHRNLQLLWRSMSAAAQPAALSASSNVCKQARREAAAPCSPGACCPQLQLSTAGPPCRLAHPPDALPRPRTAPSCAG